MSHLIFFDCNEEIGEIMKFTDEEVKNFKKLLTHLLTICPYLIKNSSDKDVFQELTKDFLFQLKNW